MALLRRFPTVDRGVERFTYWWTFLGPGGVVWLVMTWAASLFPPIAQYGIGGIIFAGLGAACILMLVASISLIAWRYFNPLKAEAVGPTGARPPDAEPSASDAELEKIFVSAERQLELLKGQHTQIASKIERITADIVRLDQLGVSNHQIADDLRKKLEHQARIQADIRNLDTKFSLFVTSVRAHDAMNEILKPNDKTAMSLGNKLMYPESYSDARSWLADYQVWRIALKEIDELVIAWSRAESTGYSPLFDLRGHHYERAPMPPENIRSDDTIIPFKTVCHAQTSYGNQRDGILAFFHQRMIYPG